MLFVFTFCVCLKQTQFKSMVLGLIWAVNGRDNLTDIEATLHCNLPSKTNILCQLVNTRATPNAMPVTQVLSANNKKKSQSKHELF